MNGIKKCVRYNKKEGWDAGGRGGGGLPPLEPPHSAYGLDGMMIWKLSLVIG